MKRVQPLPFHPASKQMKTDIANPQALPIPPKDIEACVNITKKILETKEAQNTLPEHVPMMLLVGNFTYLIATNQHVSTLDAEKLATNLALSLPQIIKDSVKNNKTHTLETVGKDLKNIETILSLLIHQELPKYPENVKNTIQNYLNSFITTITITPNGINKLEERKRGKFEMNTEWLQKGSSEQLKGGWEFPSTLKKVIKYGLIAAAVGGIGYAGTQLFGNPLNPISSALNTNPETYQQMTGIVPYTLQNQTMVSELSNIAEPIRRAATFDQPPADLPYYYSDVATNTSQRATPKKNTLNNMESMNELISKFVPVAENVEQIDPYNNNDNINPETTFSTKVLPYDKTLKIPPDRLKTMAEHNDILGTITVVVAKERAEKYGSAVPASFPHPYHDMPFVHSKAQKMQHSYFKVKLVHPSSDKYYPYKEGTIIGFKPTKALTGLLNPDSLPFEETGLKYQRQVGQFVMTKPEIVNTAIGQAHITHTACNMNGVVPSIDPKYVDKNVYTAPGAISMLIIDNPIFGYDPVFFSSLTQTTRNMKDINPKLPTWDFFNGKELQTRIGEISHMMDKTPLRWTNVWWKTALPPYLSHLGFLADIPNADKISFPEYLALSDIIEPVLNQYPELYNVTDILFQGPNYENDPGTFGDQVAARTLREYIKYVKSLPPEQQAEGKAVLMGALKEIKHNVDNTGHIPSTGGGLFATYLIENAKNSALVRQFVRDWRLEDKVFQTIYDEYRQGGSPEPLAWVLATTKTTSYFGTGFFKIIADWAISITTGILELVGGIVGSLALIKLYKLLGLYVSRLSPEQQETAEQVIQSVSPVIKNMVKGTTSSLGQIAQLPITSGSTQRREKYQAAREAVNDYIIPAAQFATQVAGTIMNMPGLSSLTGLASAKSNLREIQAIKDERQQNFGQVSSEIENLEALKRDVLSAPPTRDVNEMQRRADQLQQINNRLQIEKQHHGALKSRLTDLGSMEQQAQHEISNIEQARKKMLQQTGKLVGQIGRATGKVLTLTSQNWGKNGQTQNPQKIKTAPISFSSIMTSMRKSQQKKEQEAKELIESGNKLGKEVAQLFEKYYNTLPARQIDTKVVSAPENKKKIRTKVVSVSRKQHKQEKRRKKKTIRKQTLFRKRK